MRRIWDFIWIETPIGLIGSILLAVLLFPVFIHYLVLWSRYWEPP